MAIEGNTLSEAQITAILDGKRVIAPPREVQEVKNALAAYDRFDDWKLGSETDLLEAHGLLMFGLIDEVGSCRQGGVGVMSGEQVIHLEPPANRIPKLIADLLGWLASSDSHPLIASSVFHYEFEFIHPFADGNGRMGRLWQSRILASWNRLFANLPVESLIYAHQAEYYQAIVLVAQLPLRNPGFRSSCFEFVEQASQLIINRFHASSCCDRRNAACCWRAVNRLSHSSQSSPNLPMNQWLKSMAQHLPLGLQIHFQAALL